MRRLTVIILILFGFSFGQNIKVLDTKILVEADNTTKFNFPTFSPDGSQVLYTSDGYQGLWIYDKSTKNTKNLNNLRGAGYQPVFSIDGKQVFFRHDKLIKKRKYSSIAHQSIQNLKMKNLIKDERGISTPKYIKDNVIVYKKDDKEVVFSYEDKQVCLLKKPTTDRINAFAENSNLNLEKNGKKIILNPIGDGHYIWGSISPQKDKLLFTMTGKGTFITDLKGNVELTLKNANYPGWSPDGEWIVFMSDRDDGHVVTSSEINTVHIRTNKRFQLTSTDNKIEMYPVWSPKEDEIIYHTISGNIELLKLEIQDNVKSSIKK